MSEEVAVNFPPKIGAPPPLGLYIHLPWCVKKCPYCDFNSHQSPSEIPEERYIAALARDMERALPLVWGRRIHSIFIGGGTPSLFSPAAIDSILAKARMYFNIDPLIEITLEANPHSSDVEKFSGFKSAGVNRLSLGVQSFDDDNLRRLGRKHDGDAARRAARAGAEVFDNINIDLIHALPQQTAEAAQSDVLEAVSYQPNHLSLYQLTLEENTPFYRQPPPHLPDADTTAYITDAVAQTADAAGYCRYEVSAYARAGFRCRHNSNYWLFGDYLGVGAGAHSKLTISGDIVRTARIKNPRLYMEAADSVSETRQVSGDEAVFECLLGALRLSDGIEKNLLEQRAGAPSPRSRKHLAALVDEGLLADDAHHYCPTAKGRRFVDEMLMRLLPVRSE